MRDPAKDVNFPVWAASKTRTGFLVLRDMVAPVYRSTTTTVNENKINANILMLRYTRDLMPEFPKPKAVPFVWRWADLFPLAEKSRELVTVGRDSERRATGLANSGVRGQTYINPTLWCAIQYLCLGENAPEHRHAQNAFRFVVESEGVWTVVDGDPVHMSRGELLLTPRWSLHGHNNTATTPMA
ncbi:MAG: cupin domain-containing protein [Aestuariivita sp.]|nr:cupin domain-containing protein [Aestuariivita sp.]